MTNSMTYWFHYAFLRVALRLRLYVLDVHLHEPGDLGEGEAHCIIEPRWCWQRPRTNARLETRPFPPSTPDV